MFDSKKFETQVQEKLHGMDLSPSPAVWDKIEAQLPPENRRWGSIRLWGTLLVAAMSAGGYFFFVNTKTVSDKANSTLSANTNVNTLKNNTFNTDKAATSHNIIHAESKANDERSGLQPGAANQPAVVGEAVIKRASVGTAVPLKTTVAGKQSGSENAASFHKPAVSGQIAEGDDGGISKAMRGKNRSDVTGASAMRNQRMTGYKKSGAKNNVKSGGFNSKQVDKDAAGSEMTDVSDDRLAGRQNVKGGTSSDDLQADAALRPAVVNGDIAYHPDFKVYASVKNLEKPAAVTPLRNKKRLSFEIGASVRQSIYSAGKVKKLFTAADPAVLNSITASRPSTSPTYSFYPTAAYVPSEVKPGKSFSVGIDARYKITNRVSISGGVYYSLLTTNIQTGRKFDKEKNIDVNGRQRQIREFYSAGYSNDYTNNYHFIELPVLLRLQLNKGRKLPLYLNGGLSYSRLFNTNALHYDATAGIYYKASELVKKDFLNIEGGVSARLFPSKWYSFVIGPEIQYGITNLFKENIQQQNKHSLFLGIKASVPLTF